MKLVQFGAGNIGRSFIGQLFARAGYEVVFVDVMPEVVALLNERRRYRVKVKDTPPGTIWVENVRAVNGRDRDRVAEELATADIAGTAVGPAALQHLFPVIASLYLLALPGQGFWVFPNCRVSMHTQIDAARVAGVFSSTEVKLGPGGYLPAVIRQARQAGQDTAPLEKRIAELLRENQMSL
jgi:hypothetical protein